MVGLRSARRVRNALVVVLGIVATALVVAVFYQQSQRVMTEPEALASVEVATSAPTSPSATPSATPSHSATPSPSATADDDEDSSDDETTAASAPSATSAATQHATSSAPVYDYCPNGDYSGSRVDGTCGVAPVVAPVGTSAPRQAPTTQPAQPVDPTGT